MLQLPNLPAIGCIRIVLDSWILQVATNASLSANQLLLDAQALNYTATSFASNISQASSNVDQLEDTVRDDTDSIAMVTDTANETISVAADLTTRLLVINVSIHVWLLLIVIIIVSLQYRYSFVYVRTTCMQAPGPNMQYSPNDCYTVLIYSHHWGTMLTKINVYNYRIAWNFLGA